MPKEMVKQIIGAVAGVVIGLMFLYFGFFKTIMLVALAAVGWWLSGKREIPQSLYDFLARIRFPWR